MLYFRDREKKQLDGFIRQSRYKAMAIYGRRRTGKTALILDYLDENQDVSITYFQITTFDYASCLNDFISVNPPTSIM